jgi:spore maturation protein CgeB
MKILLAIPGHLKTVPMGRFTADELRAMGHKVEIFDYHASPWDKLRDRLTTSKEEKPGVNRRFRGIVERSRPDVFITLFGFDISKESLLYLRERRVPRICWWINDPFQFKRSAAKAPYYDFVFSNSAICPTDYRQLGVAHAHFLPTACAPSVHRPLPAEARYRADVCFAGDWSPLREQLMEQLLGRFDLRIFGPWAKKVKPDSPLRGSLSDGFFSPDEMAAMFSSAHVVINLHTWFGKFDHGVNPRLFEAAGCAAYQIVDWKQEMSQLYDCPRELVSYRSLDEIPDLISAALKDKVTIREVALAAQKRAYRDHTYANRVSTMLEIFGKAGA